MNSLEACFLISKYVGTSPGSLHWFISDFTPLRAENILRRLSSRWWAAARLTVQPAVCLWTWCALSTSIRQLSREWSVSPVWSGWLTVLVKSFKFLLISLPRYSLNSWRHHFHISNFDCGFFVFPFSYKILLCDYFEALLLGIYTFTYSYW